jgi:hypothetical protein
MKIKRPIHLDPAGGVVTKFVKPASLMCEVRMTQCAHELATQHQGLFRVPRVVDYDLSQHWIKLEYISDTAPLFCLLGSRSVPLEMFQRAGRPWPRCSQRLEASIAGPAGHRCPLGPKAFVHVVRDRARYRGASDELVCWISGFAMIDDRQLEASTGTWHFTRSLMVSPPIGWRAAFRWRLADAFCRRTWTAHLGPLGGPV